MVTLRSQAAQQEQAGDKRKTNKDNGHGGSAAIPPAKSAEEAQPKKAEKESGGGNDLASSDKDGPPPSKRQATLKEVQKGQTSDSKKDQATGASIGEGEVQPTQPPVSKAETKLEPEEHSGEWVILERGMCVHQLVGRWPSSISAKR